MKFTRESSTSLMVRTVTDDQICIGDDKFNRTVALLPTAVLDHWPDKTVDDLLEGDFGELLESSPEVIVLGTGRVNQFAPRELVFAMARRGIGLEVMDTPAAARTFNVLAGEGRRVAAVLYL